MDNSKNKAAFMGKVTASVTHEIQNVLAIIKETSGLMEDFFLMSESGGLSDIEDRLAKCMTTIKKQTYRGVNLTSMLNGFAHTTDNLQLSVNTLEITKKLVSITERLFSQKGVDIAIIDADKPYSMVTDPVLFQMMIFSCIECLMKNFETATTITLDFRAINQAPAIKFLYNDNSLEYEEYKQKITREPQWLNIDNIGMQIGLKIEVTKDNPGILITF